MSQHNQQELSDHSISAWRESGVSQVEKVDAPSAYHVRLEFFSGPMDLLLHLVHQREVPIERVEMKEICEQYLEIINRTAALDLERATEFLVIAATLISLKSQSLLPPAPEEEGNEGEVFDRRFYESLRERLKAYEQTKNRAERLMEIPQLGLDTFQRRPQKIVTGPEEFVIEEEQTSWLGELFMKLMARVGKAGYFVRMEPVSVVSMMMKCLDLLSERTWRHRPAHFLSMVRVFRRGDNAPPARASVIASFIAVLELAKRGLMHLSQAEGSDEIQVRIHHEEGQLEGEWSERLKSLHVEETAEGIVDLQGFDESSLIGSEGEPDRSKVVSMADYRVTQQSNTVVAMEESDEERKEANRG